MNQEPVTKPSSDYTYLFLFTSILVVAKTTGIVNWSWWWITIFIWGPYAVIFLIMLVGALAVVSLHLLDKFFK